MKFSFLALVIALGCSSAQAQIPVTDASQLSQQIQQVAAWGKQIAAMKEQIGAQKQLYESLNGSRGIGKLLNNPQLRETLPQDWQAVYAAVQAGGYSGLTGAAKAIRDGNAVYSCQGLSGGEQTQCQRELAKTAQDKAFSAAAYASAEQRLNNIQALMGQIDAASDPKAAADLNTRMQAESAMIQNEQTKLLMFKMMADSEDRLIAQRRREQDLLDYSKKARAADKVPPLRY